MGKRVAGGGYERAWKRTASAARRSENELLGERQQATAARGRGNELLWRAAAARRRGNEAREEKLNPIKKKRTLKTFVKKRLGQALPFLRNI